MPCSPLQVLLHSLDKRKTWLSRYYLGCTGIAYMVVTTFALVPLSLPFWIEYDYSGAVRTGIGVALKMISLGPSNRYPASPLVHLEPSKATRQTIGYQQHF